MFRQLTAADQTTDWSRLNPSLYATTFLVQRSTGRKMYHLCMGADHTQEDCALAPLQPKAVKQVAQVGETKLEKGGGGTGSTLPPRDPRVRHRSEQTCFARNEGHCHFPYCRYRHVCLRCRGDHQASSCTAQQPYQPPNAVPLGSRHPGFTWGCGPPPGPSQP